MQKMVRRTFFLFFGNEKRNRALAAVPFALLFLLASLIAYGAGCLTCRLAGCLAFAAAAFFHCIL